MVRKQSSTDTGKEHEEERQQATHNLRLTAYDSSRNLDTPKAGLILKVRIGSRTNSRATSTLRTSAAVPPVFTANVDGELEFSNCHLLLSNMLRRSLRAYETTFLSLEGDLCLPIPQA